MAASNDRFYHMLKETRKTLDNFKEKKEAEKMAHVLRPAQEFDEPKDKVEREDICEAVAEENFEERVEEIVCRILEEKEADSPKCLELYSTMANERNRVQNKLTNMTALSVLLCTMLLVLSVSWLLS